MSGVEAVAFKVISWKFQYVSVASSLKEKMKMFDMEAGDKSGLGTRYLGKTTKIFCLQILS